MKSCMPVTDLTAQQKFKLRQFVNELKGYRANHTEMVTVYIPAGYELTKITGHLAEEQGTASNIKSTSTRKNVQAALERMIQHLRLYKNTPQNGLCAFSGNIAAREGQQDVRVWSIEPPIPVQMRTYRCDKTFVLDILEDMLQDKTVYGLVVMDRRDANIALLKGKTIIPLAKTHSQVPGKFKAGGQCLVPETLVETHSQTPLAVLSVGDELKTYNFLTKKVEKTVITDKWEVEKSNILHIETENEHTIICSADHFIFTENNSEKAADELRVGDSVLEVSGETLRPVKIVSIKNNKKKTKLIDISVKSQNFIANGILVHNSAQRFHRIIEDAAKEHYRKVAEYVKEQFLPIKELKGILVGGPGPTKHDFIELGQITNELKKKIIAVRDLSYTDDFGLHELVEKCGDVLASEEITKEKKIMEQFFQTLAKTPEKATYGKDETLRAVQMGAVDTLLLSETLDEKTIEFFTAEAEKMKSTVTLVSVATREGVQLKELGAIAAILRYGIG